MIIYPNISRRASFKDIMRTNILSFIQHYISNKRKVKKIKMIPKIKKLKNHKKKESVEQKKEDKGKVPQNIHDGFKFQKTRSASRRGNQQGKERYEWNPRPPGKEKEILMWNKYGALKENRVVNNEE